MNINETVEVTALDDEGYTEYIRDFDTMKEARAHYKTICKDRKFWVRRSESEEYPSSIHTIQLIKNGEVIKTAPRG